MVRGSGAADYLELGRDEFFFRIEVNSSKVRRSWTDPRDDYSSIVIDTRAPPACSKRAPANRAPTCRQLVVRKPYAGHAEYADLEPGYLALVFLSGSCWYTEASPHDVV